MEVKPHVSLDHQLPRELAVGGGTALLVAGTCFSPRARIESLELVVDGERQPLMAYGMPRLDFSELVSRNGQDPMLRSYRSGFWGMARIARAPGSNAHWLGLRASMKGGAEVEAQLARIPEADHGQPPASPPWPQGSAQPRIAICMATYDPPAALLRRQLDSIRAQSHQNWICLISDDHSSAQAYAAIEREVGDDPRFLISRCPARQGFFGNFERALRMAPRDAEFVAMADQDDRWYPDKLAVLLEAIGDTKLVYSDARIVSRSGQPVADTYWSTRRNNHSDLLSLLVANSVTGASALLRREVLDYALPFPAAQFAHFHDHWVALTALALGEIAFVDRPLYDYVQHGEAVLGHAAAMQMTGLMTRLRQPRPVRERVRMWRLHYFVDVCRLMQLATILELRCGERMCARKRRALHRFLTADRSLAGVVWLFARGARELVGTPETLGAEWMLAHALVWRRLLEASARDRPQQHFRLDAVPPPTLLLRPAPVVSHAGVADEISAKIAPLDLAVSADAPERVNVLIPTIDLQHFFGGYIAKLNLAKRLAALGPRVRVLTVDPVPPLPPDWRRQVESYAGLDGLFDCVELEFGRGPSLIEVSAADTFIASTWWTAHIAAAALRTLDDGAFAYLIQEYEPFTFPMGTYAALAAQSYRFEHFALFSSELLRGYFRHNRIGVFADGADAGDRRSASFQNAITAVEPPTEEELAGRQTRKLLFYARPEAHAARNMFELGVLALGRAAEQGALDGWQLHGIGAVTGSRAIELGGGATLELLARAEQSAYAQLLREHDAGLALMYTPHPSLVPLEMASAGMLAVTNTFENKTAQELAEISPNIIAAEPSVDQIASALAAAAAIVGDHRARVQGSAVRWSRDWDQSFDRELLRPLIDALRR